MSSPTKTPKRALPYWVMPICIGPTPWLNAVVKAFTCEMNTMLLLRQWLGQDVLVKWGLPRLPVAQA